MESCGPKLPVHVRGCHQSDKSKVEVRPTTLYNIHDLKTTS